MVKKFILSFLLSLGFFALKCDAQIGAFFGATTARTGYATLAVSFRDSTTGAHLWKWHWVWDNTNQNDTGTTPFSPVFSHTYATSGFYTVKMVVYDSLGHIDSFIRTNYVVVRPQAKFTGTPLSGQASLPVHFTNQTTGGHIWKYHFQFDSTNKSDTQNFVNTTFNFTHTYSLSGNYTVKLIVYDSLGNKDSLPKTNYVQVGLKAGLSLSPQNGCVSAGNPLHITMTDGSQGGHLWKWFYCFDTTNHADTSVSPFTANPITTYTAQGTYVVKHVVYDSLGNRDSVFKTILVTGPPVVRFYSPDTMHLCAPYTATFYNQSDSTPSCTTNFQWYIDTAIIHTTHVSQTVSYTFTRPGFYDIALSESEACNCGTANVTQHNYIKVDSLSTPCFTTNDTNGCGAPYSVHFNNCSVNATSYLWRFGDGTSDTAANPVHIYSATNTTGYTDSLTSFTLGGCPTTTSKIHQIKVGHFNAGFQTYLAATPGVSTTIICPGTSLTLKDTTFGSTNHHWRFSSAAGDTGNAVAPIISHTWASSGIYTVVDSAYNVSGCSGVASHVIFVAPPPTVDSIRSVHPYRCSAPDTVQFTSYVRDTTTYNLEWHFGEPITGENDTAYSDSVHIYNLPGFYSPSLKVRDAYGCQTTVTLPNYVNIAAPYAAIRIVNDSGCVHMTAYYSDTVGAGGLALMKGQDYFLDSVVYNDGSPADTGINIIGSHAYNTAGRFMMYHYFHLNPSLGGCAYADSIQVSAGDTPMLANRANMFIADSLCPQVLYRFFDSCSNCNSGLWKIANTIYRALDTTVLFSNFGMKSIMYVANYNGCTDTLRDSIYIWPPNALFTISTPVCSNRDSLQFTNTSGSAAGTPAGYLYHYLWDFGDGSPLLASAGTTTVNPAPVTHVYSVDGTYTVTLTDSSISPNYRGCTNKLQQTVFIYPIVNADSDITVTKPLTCKGSVVTMKAYMTQYNRLYSSYVWRFGDGLSSTVTTTDTINHSYAATGVYNDTLIIKNIYGCFDTIRKPGFVTIETPRKAVNANGLSTTATIPVTGCSYFHVSFHDSVTAFPGTALTKRRWQFNGAPAVTGVNTPPTTVIAGTLPQTDTSINFPIGNYRVFVIDSDDHGCFSIDTVLINSVKPHAYFTSNDTVACSHVAIHFHDTTTHVSKNWLFGDNTGVIASLSADTVHYYFQNGTYSDTLITISDGTGGMMSGCRDTSIRSNFVQIGNSSVNAGFNFSGIAFAGCPPLTVHTVNTSSSVSANFYKWKFGVDSLVTSSNTSPTFTYNYPGTYTVTLIDSNTLGCKDTVRNTVSIGGPTGTLSMIPDTVCMGAPILLHLVSSSLTPGVDTPFFWQSGYGSATYRNDTSGFVTSYPAAGTYHPSVTIYQTSTGCSVTVYAKDSVQVRPKPVILAPTDSICKGASVTVSVSGANAWVWSPAYGLSSTTKSNPVANPTVTTTYTLTGITGHGCVDSIPVTVYVNPTPTAISGILSACAGFNSTLANGTGGGIWSSQNTAVATVNASGVVTGVSQGTAIISYTIGNCTSTAIFTVNLQPDAIAGNAAVCNLGSTTVSEATTGGTWSSANSTIATVTAAGVVVGHSAGLTTISYTKGSCSALQIVTVNPKPSVIAGISALCQNSENTITLSDSLAGGYWSVSDTTKVKIDSAAGYATGYASGSAVVTYTMPVTGCTRTVTINVYGLPGSITGGTVLCANGETQSTLHSATATGIWTSADSTIARIDSVSGVVTGHATGATTISYTLPTTGCYRTQTVTVFSLPDSITGVAAVCEAGQNHTTLYDSTAGGLWSSSTTAVATIGSTTGSVTGVTVGNATLTYKISATGCYTTIPLTVNARPAIISGLTSVCEAGEGSITLTDSISGGIWKSGNTALCTVDSLQGIVTGVTSGTPRITYTAAGTGCYRTVIVTVMARPAAITGTLKICEAGELPSILHNTTSPGTWSLNDATIATVDPVSGAVSGIQPGNPIVTYTGSVSGCYRTAVLTVNQVPAPISGAPALCENGEGSDTLSDISGPGTWSSSNTANAVVNSVSGVVNGVTAGTANISYTLTASGCYSLFALTVNPRPAPVSGTASVCAGLQNSVTLSSATTGGRWITADTSTARIDSISGLLTGVNAGSTLIYYKDNATGCYATVTGTVQPLPANITGVAVVCEASETTTTLADVTPGGSWSSSSTATVVANGTTGVLTGVTSGVATITYKVNATGCYATTVASVNPRPALISGSNFVCEAGQTADTLSDSLPGGVWTLSNSALALIDAASGVVTGVAPGTLNITYTNPGTGCYRILPFTVRAKPAPITGIPSVCAAGQNSVMLHDGSAPGTWTSSDNTLATIDATSGGLVGVVAGNPIITYTYSLTGCYQTVVATVNATPGPITGNGFVCEAYENPDTLSVNIPGGTWISSSSSHASVDAVSGVVLGVSAGAATITYRLPGLGCFATFPISVNPKPTGILGTPVVCEGNENSAILTNASGSGIWSISDTSKATIGIASGILTGVTAGNPEITFTNAATGCYNHRTATVNPMPSAISGPNNVCESYEDSVLMSSSPGSGVWSVSNTGIGVVNGVSGLLKGVSHGIAIVTYTIPATGCYATYPFTVNALPSAISGNSPICAGGQSSTTLNSSPATGVWSAAPASVATVGPATGIVSGISSGSAQVTYTLSGTGCYRVTVVTINPLPKNISGTNSVCASGLGRAILIDSTLGGSWSASLPALATVTAYGSDSAMVTGISPGTTQITYTLAGTGCYAKIPFTVNVTPAPIVGETGICKGTTRVYTESTPGGSWSTSTPTLIATSAGPSGINVSALGSGVASLTYSLGSCYASSQITINTQPKPINGTFHVCKGHTITLTDSTASGVWSSNNGSVAGINPANGILTGFGADTVTIRYKIGNCGVSTIVTVNVQPDSVTGPTILCGGQVATLGNLVSGGTWSSSTPGIASISTSGVLTAHATGMGVVSYTLGNCMTALSVTVNPQPGPIFGISGPVCNFSAVSLSNILSFGKWRSTNPLVATVDSISGVLYTHSVGLDTVSYVYANCRSDLPMVVAPQPAPITGGNVAICNLDSVGLTNDSLGGIWTNTDPTRASITPAGVVTGITPGIAHVAYSINSCTAYTTVTINVQPPAIVGGNQMICNSTSTTLTNVVTGGVWSLGTTGIFSADTLASNILELVATGVGSSSLTYTVGNCTATTSLSVAVQPGPLSGSQDSVCQSSTITFTESGTGGSWSTGNASVATISGGVVTGVLSGITTSDTTSVAYTIGSCAARRVVTVNPKPVLVGNDTLICKYAGGRIQVSGAATYTWQPALGLSCTNCDNPYASPLVTTVYTVTGTSVHGCVSDFSLRDSVTSMKPLVVTGRDSVCAGLADTLTATGGVGYVWSPSVGLDCNSCGQVQASPTGTTTYTLVGTDNVGCHDTSYHLVRVLPLPSISGPLKTPVICSGTAFEYTTVLSDSTATAHWYRNPSPDVAPYSASGIGSVSETLYYSGAGIDTVLYLFALSGHGCRDTQYLKVPVESLPVKTPIASSPALTLCDNTLYQQFAASALPTLGTYYNWSVVNADIWTVSADKMICIVNFNTTGNSSVILQTGYTGYACVSADTVNLVIEPIAAGQVTVTYDNYNFVSMLYLADSYQWGYDDAATLASTNFAGEINQNYYNRYPDFTHKYYWVKTVKNGCAQKSYYNAPTAVTNVNAMEEPVVNAYPNPADKSVTVEVGGVVQTDILIGICDASGKLVSQVKYDGPVKLDISNLADGFYMLGIIKGNGLASAIKIIKIGGIK